MQSLDVISVNIWNTLISLCNLLILFLILKKFLYKPVKKVLETRRQEVDSQYEEADAAKNHALTMEKEWNERLSGVDAEAKELMRKAQKNAQANSDAILEETKKKADRLVRQAQADAAAEYKKAEAEMKQEIIDVSTKLSEKILGREIKAEDHHAMIDSFLDEIGEDDDSKQ